ncbi:MAG: sodium:proton antiporter, partial [FCB group bacterium]
MQTIIPIYTLLPFLLMLALIAVFPIYAPTFWQKNKNKLFIALILSFPVAVWMLAKGLGSPLY